MAKKARKKVGDDPEHPAFRFPEFEIEKFLQHEFEQTFAVLVALVLAVVLGVVSWAIDRAGLPDVIPVVLGIAGIAFSPYLIQRLRRDSGEYTKGDWAGLILVEAFGWLGLWFLLLNVLRG